MKDEVEKLIAECTERGQLNETWFVPKLLALIDKAEKSAMLRQRAYDQKLIDKAQVEAVRAARIEELEKFQHHYKFSTPLEDRAYLKKRLASLREDGETK